MSKPTKATKYIHEAAKCFQDSGATIAWDSAFSTVSIECDREGIFMQGEEADSFIDELKAMTCRYPSLDEYTAACALADPIIECLFN
jgi:hypothetical protein